MGEEAVWSPQSRSITCLACATGQKTALEGAAGASALREHERRRLRREQPARDRLGRLGVLLARVVEEPQSTRAWKQGAMGEIHSGKVLAKHLHGHAVKLLHDRRIPRHGNANIDHITVGPGGVTVIDTKTHRGKVHVERVGGLLSERRSLLRIAGRDRSALIDGVERQMELVSAAVQSIDRRLLVDVRGALCFPNVDGLPILSELSVRGVMVSGPRAVAKLARRAGPYDVETIDAIWSHLGGSFPPA